MFAPMPVSAGRRGTEAAERRDPHDRNETEEGDHMIIRTVLAVAAIALGVTAVVAQQDPIAARKALMKANGEQAGIGGKMARARSRSPWTRRRRFSRPIRRSAAKAPALFPDNPRPAATPASLPAIWENKADFDAKLAKFGQRREGRGGHGDGSRHLQGAVRRGAEELRRLPPDLSQAPELTLPGSVESKGRPSSTRRPSALFGAGSPDLALELGDGDDRCSASSRSWW